MLKFTPPLENALALKERIQMASSAQADYPMETIG